MADDPNAILKEAEKLIDGEFVLYSGPINDDGYGQIIQVCEKIKSNTRLCIVLVTYGGSADSAYRIARFAQSFFEDFIVFVPSICKSAGTLITLGASEIYMSPFGELGPLDVQVAKANELFERRSGLLSKSAVWSLTEEAFRIFESHLLNIKLRSGGTIGFKAASEVAADITTGLLSPVFSQLDPLVIGEDYQNLKIATEYGERLICKFDKINRSAVDLLVNYYPSHGFVIDYQEAAQLFGNVKIADKKLLKLLGCLGEESHRPNRDAAVINLREYFGGNDEVQAQRAADESSVEGGNQSEGNAPADVRADRIGDTGKAGGRNRDNKPARSNEGNGNGAGSSEAEGS